MKLLNFNQLQFDSILGNLLGDASLQTFTNGKTWRLRFIQKDKDYLFYLYDLFGHLVSTPPKSITDKHGSTRWYFNTTVLHDGQVLADLFYIKKGGKWVKTLNKNLYPQLTAASLAHWFMDDGSLKQVRNSQAYILCTDSFSLSELKELAQVFQTQYNIHVSFHKQRTNQYRIYIPVKHRLDFKNLVEEYIVPSMKYKLGK